MTKDKLQEMADDLGIAFILHPDGSVAHHPPDKEDPSGVVIIRPRKPWTIAPHGPPDSTSVDPAKLENAV